MEQQAPFKIRPFADVGTSEAFFARISGLLDLLGATDLQQEEARRTKEAIILICFEGLFPAFSHLRQIRKQPDDLPELNRRQPYDDFTRALWHSYKDLAQGAIRELGFDIGFLFKSQDAFEQGAKRFQEAHPEVSPILYPFLRRQRERWQNLLAHVRNDYLEHRKVDFERVRGLYDPQQAEIVFESVWTTIEEIFVILICSRLPSHIKLMEIPEAERDPKNPVRFSFAMLRPEPSRRGEEREGGAHSR